MARLDVEHAKALAAPILVEAGFKELHAPSVDSFLVALPLVVYAIHALRSDGEHKSVVGKRGANVFMG